jgi:hypothetical protein
MYDRLPQRSVSIGFLAASFLAASFNAMTVSFVAAGNVTDFKNPLNNSPMTFELQPDEVETPAIKKFKETGENDYRRNANALADGKNLYATALAATALMEPARWARRWSARMSSTNRC